MVIITTRTPYAKTALSSPQWSKTYFRISVVVRIWGDFSIAFLGVVSYAVCSQRDDTDGPLRTLTIVSIRVNVTPGVWLRCFVPGYLASDDCLNKYDS